MNKFKHDILLRIVKSINIILITIPFAVCWFFYYADHVVSPFYSKGNWLVILLFLVFYITFGRIYDAFLYQYTLSLKSCIHKYFRQCCLTESCMSSFVCCPKASPICSQAFWQLPGSFFFQCYGHAEQDDGTFGRSNHSLRQSFMMSAEE